MRHDPSSRQPGRDYGFTLIELVIAIVIVAVLASVALPSFFDSIRKSRRSEAITALNAVQQAQERWRANKPSYATDLSSAAPTGLGFQSSTPTGYYTIALANVLPDGTGYDVTATAVSGTSQAKDLDCAFLGVRMAGGNLQYAGSSSAGSLAYASSNKCWSR